MKAPIMWAVSVQHKWSRQIKFLMKCRKTKKKNVSAPNNNTILTYLLSNEKPSYPERLAETSVDPWYLSNKSNRNLVPELWNKGKFYMERKFDLDIKLRF